MKFRWTLGLNINYLQVFRVFLLSVFLSFSSFSFFRIFSSQKNIASALSVLVKVRLSKISFYVTDHYLIKLKRLSLNTMNKKELFLSLVLNFLIRQ